MPAYAWADVIGAHQLKVEAKLREPGLTSERRVALEGWLRTHRPATAIAEQIVNAFKQEQFELVLALAEDPAYAQIGGPGRKDADDLRDEDEAAADGDEVYQEIEVPVTPDAVAFAAKFMSTFREGRMNDLAFMSTGNEGRLLRGFFGCIESIAPRYVQTPDVVGLATFLGLWVDRADTKEAAIAASMLAGRVGVEFSTPLLDGRENEMIQLTPEVVGVVVFELAAMLIFLIEVLAERRRRMRTSCSARSFRPSSTDTRVDPTSREFVTRGDGAPTCLAR